MCPVGSTDWLSSPLANDGGSSLSLLLSASRLTWIYAWTAAAFNGTRKKKINLWLISGPVNMNLNIMFIRRELDHPMKSHRMLDFVHKVRNDMRSINRYERMALFSLHWSQSVAVKHSGRHRWHIAAHCSNRMGMVNYITTQWANRTSCISSSHQSMLNIIGALLLLK